MENSTIYETIKVKLKMSEPRATVKDPETVIALLKTLINDLDADQEHFLVLMLNKSNNVTGFKIIASGGQSETTVDLKVLFRNALLMGATAIIVCHNHPSGRVDPSPEDMQMTRKIKESGDMIGIRLLDHIIIGNNQYLSFQEKGLL